MLHDSKWFVLLLNVNICWFINFCCKCFVPLRNVFSSDVKDVFFVMPPYGWNINIEKLLRQPVTLRPPPDVTSVW